MEVFNPAGSSKDRTARSLIEDAEAKGQISASTIILESTSGNLGIALSRVCKERGYPFVAVIDPNTTPESIGMMREMGAQIEMVNERSNSGGYLIGRLERVQQLCETSSRYLWLNQYANPANPYIHYATTAPEIYSQMNREVDAIFVAVSTGGTLAGIAKYFREVSPATKIVAVDAVGSVIFGGPPGPRRLTGIGSARSSDFLQKSHYDFVYSVTDEDAFMFCRTLFDRTRIKIGGSSGAVLIACTDFIFSRSEIENVVCLCADGGQNYDSTIFNESWLKEEGIVLPKSLPIEDITVDPEDTFERPAP